MQLKKKKRKRKSKFEKQMNLAFNFITEGNKPKF